MGRLQQGIGGGLQQLTGAWRLQHGEPLGCAAAGAGQLQQW
jgi:hypothetical protein